MGHTLSVTSAQKARLDLLLYLLPYARDVMKSEPHLGKDVFESES